MPIPPAPSETSIHSDSDNSGPQQMDVDTTEPDPEGASASDDIPEGANQIRFLQRHNAIMRHNFEDTVTQSPLPWTGHVE